MGWNGILRDVVSGNIILVIGGWFVGLVNGKKESSTTVERKKALHPL